MAIKKLLRINIFGLQKEKQSILDNLHKFNCLHIKSLESEQESVKKDTSLPIQERIASKILELKWMKDQLKHYIKKHSSDPNPINPNLKQDLNIVNKLKKEIYSDLYAHITDINYIKEKTKSYEERITLFNKVPFDLLPSHIEENEHNFILLVRQRILNKKKIISLEKKLTHLKLNIVSKNDFFLIQGLKKDKKEVLNIVKQNTYNSIISLPNIHTSTKADLKYANKKIKFYETKFNQLDKKVAAIANKHYTTIFIALNNLSMFKERYAITSSAIKTDKTFFLQAYIPKINLAKLKKLPIKVTIEEENLESDIPVALKNNWYTKRYEFVTKMFGLPKYGSLDPTIYISFFLPIFFGFMFSDIGYGLMLMILSIFMISKATAYHKILKDAGIIFFTSSISTIIFGWLFGSFFGNLIKIKPLLFDPFVNAKLVLIIALVIGLVHLNIGLLLDAFLAIKKRNPMHIVLTDLPIWLLQAGGALLVTGNSLAGYISLGIAVGIFVSKNKIMGLMDITGFAGTWFSYARLLALCLATGGISLGINIIAKLFLSIPYIGILLFILVVIFGHLFNFALNILGSSVHSVRLHYIEFFSQFYETSNENFKEYSPNKVNDSF